MPWASSSAPQPGDSFSSTCPQCGGQTVTIYSTAGWVDCNPGTRRVFRGARSLDLVTLDGDLATGLAGDVTEIVIGWPLHIQMCQPRTQAQ